MCRTGHWSVMGSGCDHDPFTAMWPVPYLTTLISAATPTPLPTLLSCQGHPGPICLSGCPSPPSTPTQGDRRVSCIPTVSPCWVHSKRSACVWGWMRERMHLDTKQRWTRDPQASSRLRSHPQFTSCMAASPASGGLKQCEHLAGRKCSSRGPIRGGGPLVSPQGWAHSQLCLSTCVAIPTPPPSQQCTHGLPGNCKK